MNERREPRPASSEQQLVQKSTRSYYAEVAAEAFNTQIALIEQLIDVAFGDLGARHLEVRVVDGLRCKAVVCA